jgi:hypothetical protein
MNRSFSKIRHIQEVNQRLEKRLMSEQVQTTVTQTGENPGTKTKINPPMSKAIPEISGNTPTITNPFKDPSLLEKFVGKQFQTYSKYDETPEAYDSYEIEKAYFQNRNVVFDIDYKQKARYDCTLPDTLFLTLNDYDASLRGKKQYGTAVAAPSLTKELKQTFCTVGTGNQSVPKVDYPTP